MPPMPGASWALGFKAQGSEPSLDTDQNGDLSSLLEDTAVPLEHTGVSNEKTGHREFFVS